MNAELLNAELFFADLPEIATRPGPILLLLTAMALDAAFGPGLARFLPDPAAWSRRTCADYDRRLNKESRGDKARLLRGMIVVVALMCLAAAAGWGAQWLAAQYRGGRLLELAVLLCCLRAGAALSAARRVATALESGALPAARDAAQPLTRRHALSFDQYAAARATLEHTARAFVRRLVAPAFWWLLLGLPGVLMLAAAEGADAAVGRAGARHERFGLTAATLDDALNYLPARLAALLLALAAPFLAGGSLKRAFATLFSDAGKHPSRNMGAPIAALAGALDLALAGPHRDGGVVIDEAWIGSGKARATPQDIARGLTLSRIAALLLALSAALLLLLAAG